MRRKKKLSLTVEGGILFGILMLVAVIALTVTLLSAPSREDVREKTEAKVWAEVLTNADFARLGRLSEKEAKP